IYGVGDAAFAHYGRRPTQRRDSDHDENPDRLLFPPDDRSDLSALEFHSRESLNFSIIKPPAAGGSPFQPPMHGVPADPVDSSDNRLVEALDTEGGDSIKCGATVLESIIGRASRRGEGLSTSLTLVPTTLSPPRRVEAVATDGSDAFSRARAVPVGTAETLHGWWNLETQELLLSNLSLKL